MLKQIHEGEEPIAGESAYILRRNRFSPDTIHLSTIEAVNRSSYWGNDFVEVLCGEDVYFFDLDIGKDKWRKDRDNLELYLVRGNPVDRLLEACRPNFGTRVLIWVLKAING